MTVAKSKRRWPREQVAREAEVRRGDDLYVGTILDVSNGGAFFRPEAGVIDGLFTQIEHAAGLTPGTAVFLRDADQVPAAAIVRWEGCSERHRCRGLGLDIG